MKSKLKNLIVLCLMLFFCVFSGCLESDDKNGYNEVGSEGLIYALSSDSISYDVIGYNGTENNIIIPSVYKGLPVIGIRKLEISNSNIESIIIPNSIKNINDYAFSNLKSSLIIYCKGNINSSKWISDKIVYFRVTEVIEQEGITYAIINNKAVVTKYVGKDSKVEIPSTITYNNNTYNVTEIGSYSFSECTVLTSITIPNSLTSIEIPSSVINIDSFAFSDCTSLTNVYYNGTIINWCNISFESMDSNPMSYANHFYMKDSNNKYQEVTEIEIPNTITKIGNFQFCGFNSVISITIPSSVTSIEKCAFRNCSSLTSITIPSSVINIGSWVFEFCTSLTIYCKATSKPSGWDSNWNSGRPVYWN